MKEALFYRKLKESMVQCQLCPHFCVLKDKEIGKCKARVNKNGTLISLVYANPCSYAIDPIEKKPFYHFLPGERVLSVATAGCNLKCKFCQNSEISQASTEELPYREMNPEKIVEEAKKQKIKIIAYTYTEPIIFFEYMLDICKLAKKQGIKNVIVSNGFINPKPLKKLSKYIDAANIDLKSIDDNFYREICSAKIEPVLETLKILKKEKVWTEITNLIIPTLNDSENGIEKLILWVKDNLGKESVLHFTAFYPCYQLLELPPTPIETLKKAREVALKEGMKYIYTGNLLNEEGDNTYCPKCGNLLIKRRLFSVIENNLNKGKCPKCNEKIPGVWS